MLFRLANLGVTNVFVLLRLLPRSDHDKDTEILVLRHQIAVLQRQLGDRRIRFQVTDRALLPRYYAHSPTQRCSDHACWSARTRSRAGTATCSPAATLPPADPTGATDHKRCVPSAPWSCAWPGRTAAGATGAGTANS